MTLVLKNKKAPFSLDSVELLEYQPNRYPFLMIDYVEEVFPGKYARGYKNLTLNEWYFPKHFQGAPNMPGALQLESLAQMLTVALTTIPGNRGKVIHGIKHTVRFKKEVLPGQTLIIDTKLTSYKRGLAHGDGVAYINNEVACEAEMILSIPDVLKNNLPK